MSHFRQTEMLDHALGPDRDPSQGYASLIRRTMAEKQIGHRKLALVTGISKTRLGCLLHGNPAKRGAISLDEFKRILRGLDISIVRAFITVESDGDPTLFHDRRFATTVAMLTELFQGLPATLLAALDQIEGIDGTEVRKEWAGPLRQAVVEKLVKEVSAVMARRETLSQLSNFGV